VSVPGDTESLRRQRHTQPHTNHTQPYTNHTQIAQGAYCGTHQTALLTPIQSGKTPPLPPVFRGKAGMGARTRCATPRSQPPPRYLLAKELERAETRARPGCHGFVLQRLSRNSAWHEPQRGGSVIAQGAEAACCFEPWVCDEVQSALQGRQSQRRVPRDHFFRPFRAGPSCTWTPRARTSKLVQRPGL
jgi:hypothetical protein